MRRIDRACGKRYHKVQGRKMSRYINEKLSTLDAYVPGEQPKDAEYIKLNTNESPYPPHPSVYEAVRKQAGFLNLYSDPESKELTEKVAENYNLEYENLLMTNGSDEILAFAFAAYGGGRKRFVFPSVTYGFYPVFAGLFGVKYEEKPPREDFSINADDYCGVNANVVIANPNAPTGLTLSIGEIEKIAATNKRYVVIIDEAYVDFGGESALGLINKYGNLLVTRTFSKSFSLAGGRLGFGAGSRELIADLKKVKYSFNPYNVNRMTAAAGVAAMDNWDYYANNCLKIAGIRDKYKRKFRELGFFVTDSKANFLFVSHEKISGEELYSRLREKGILIRHFDKNPIENFNRITVGLEEQMEILYKETEKIIRES